jgi:hypothetical protein
LLAAPTLVNLDGDIVQRLLAIPAGAGVGQILGDEGRSLVIGRPASLRRWAASHLGAGRPPRPGKRPPTDLRPVARAVSFTPTTSAFHQRLVFERLMARHVPRSARRDLKPPAYLHLDPSERFPRVTVRGVAPAGSTLPGLFGPFRNRRAATRAVAVLHKRFPLRPCDYEFQPAADLALGLGCVYAQVHTCAAPCLTRVTEDAYRGLAAEAAHFLAGPQGRPEEARSWIPEWVSAADSRAVVIEESREGFEIYPVVAGTVLDDQIRTAQGKDIEGALEGMRWTGADETGHDRDWLAGWLYTPKRTGRYVVLDGDGNDSALVRRAMEQAPHVP